MEQDKIIFVAKDDSHILSFHLPYLKYFYDKGYTTIVVSEGNQEIPFTIKKINMTFGANPFSRELLKSYKQLKKIINDPTVKLVHTHTAIASVLSRVSIKKDVFKGKMFYTSHGYHFMRGGNIINWIYYPIEKLLSRKTDVLILINDYDYELSKRYFKAKYTYKIDGIGVGNHKIFPISEIEKSSKQLENNSLFRITYIAELNKNKNQMMLIHAVECLVKSYRYNINLNLVGIGSNESVLKQYVKNNNLENCIFFLGYRDDIGKILSETDLYVSTSQREGLGLNLIEALLNNVPVLASNIRGHDEIVTNDINGYLFNNKEELENHLIYLYNNRYKLKDLSRQCYMSVEKYKLDNVYDRMISIYSNHVSIEKM